MMIRLVVLLLLLPCIAFGQMDIVLQTGNKSTITNLEFSQSERYLLSSDDHTLIIWDLNQRKQYAAIQSEKIIQKSGFLNDHSLYISTGERIEFWDFTSEKMLHQITAKQKISDVVYHENVLYYFDKKLIKYNVKEERTEVLAFNEASILSLSLSGNSEKLCLWNKSDYFIYNLATNTVDYMIDIPNVVTSYLSDETNILSTAVFPSSIHNFSLSADKFKKRNVISNTKKWNNYNSICLTDKYGLTGDSEDVITVFNSKNGKIIRRIQNKSGLVSKIAVTNSFKLIAAGGNNGVINIYDQSLKKLHTFKPISPVPVCAHLLSDSSSILIGYDNGLIKSWNFITNETFVISPSKPKRNILSKKTEIISISETGGLLKNVWSSLFSNRFKEEYITYEINKNRYSLLQTLKKNQVNLGKSVCSPQLPKTEKITFCSTFTVNGYYLVGSTSGFLSFHDQSGKLVLKMVSPSAESFFYSTPNNYYFASKNALNYVSARYNSKLIGFEQIDLIYNRPDKILPILSSSFSAEYISLLEKAHNKRLNKLGLTKQDFNKILELPAFSSNLKTLPFSTKDSTISITIRANSAVPLKSLHVLINEVPIFGKDGLAITGLKYEENQLIKLSSGANNVKIFVENELGSKSLRESAQIDCKYNYKPNLYILSIGSGSFLDTNYNLKFASKDAAEVTQLFEETKSFQNVFSKTILEKEVTADTVYKAILNLQKASINDVVLIFFAGHGVLDANLDYYLSAFNMDFNQPTVNGIKFDDFENALSLLKCRHKLLLIDACHSGEVDKDEIENTRTIDESDEELLVFRSGAEGIDLIGGESAFALSQNIFVDLRSTSGVITISSAGAAEYALEGEKWKNGAFTYCLLSGMYDRNADTNKDRKVTINELQTYLFKEVPKLTKGKQTPTSRVELLEQNFVIW